MGTCLRSNHRRADKQIESFSRSAEIPPCTNTHTHMSCAHIYRKLVRINTHSLLSESALSFHSSITRLSNPDCLRSSDFQQDEELFLKPCQMTCVCVCECVCVRLCVRAVTYGRAQEPRRCCPGSRCLHRTSSAPGCSGCSCKQTPQTGTEEGARKTGSLWKEKQERRNKRNLKKEEFKDNLRFWITKICNRKEKVPEVGGEKCTSLILNWSWAD